MKVLNCRWLVVLVLVACAGSSSAQENDFWINPSGGLYINFFNWGDETSPGSLDTANFNLPNLYDVDWVDNYAPVAELNVTDGNVLFRSPGSESGGTIWEYEVLDDVNVNDSSFFVGFGTQGHQLTIGADLNVDGDARMEVLGNSTMTIAGQTSIGESSIFSVGGSIVDATGDIFFGTGNFGGPVDDTAVQVEDGASLIVGGLLDVGSGNNSMTTMDVYNGSSVSESEGTYIGAFPGSTGELLVRDAGSIWSSSGMIRVGWQGIGMLSVEDQGSVTGESVIIGDVPGSLGTVNVSGALSSLSANENIQIGAAGMGLVNLSDCGSLVSGELITVGPQGEIDVNQPGLTATISAAGGLVNEGLLDLRIGSPVLNANVTNLGTIQSTSGAITKIEGSLIHDGVEIFTTSSASVQVANTASGTGPYTGTGTTRFEAAIEPGASDGINAIASISFEGNVEMASGTITQIEISGTSIDGFDRLLIEGDVSVDGDINVYDLGHTFVSSDEFVIIEIGGVRTGEFTGLPEGSSVGVLDEIELFITYAGGDGNDIALVTNNDTVLLGDVNLDRVVNLLDVAPFIALISSGVFQAEADINGDSVVNLLDVADFVDLLAG